MNEKGRTIFYGVAGAYLIYLAYDMFQTKAAVQDVKLLIFSVVFGVAGVILLIMAGKSYKKSMTEALADDVAMEESVSVEETTENDAQREES